MWRWLPSVLCNKSVFYISTRRWFFLQLISIVFGAHFLILLISFFVSWLEKDTQKFHVSLLQHNTTYVLMPLHKKVLKNQETVKNSVGLHKKSKLIDHETYLAKKKAKQKKNNRNSVISKSTLSSTKAEIQETKKMATNSVSKVAKKVSLVIKSESSKDKSIKKSKQTMVIPEIVDIEIVAPLVLPVNQPELKDDEQQNVSAQITQSEKDQIVEKTETINLEVDQQLDDFDEENVVFVGYQELDQSMIASKIAYTVQQCWKAPVGMNKDVSCDVSVKVDTQGTGLSAKIIKSSGVFVYDLSARKALLKIQYPKEVWNKTITITLGSS